MAKPVRDEDFELPLPGALKPRQPVELEVVAQTDLGYKAIIDDRYIGMIFFEDMSQPLRIGEYLKGWIKTVRPDGKIDLSITMLDDASRNELEDAIMKHLHRNGGAARLSDKSSPEEIFRLFKASKKNFKRAIGKLYKDRRIIIADDSIRIA